MYLVVRNFVSGVGKNMESPSLCFGVFSLVELCQSPSSVLGLGEVCTQSSDSFDAWRRCLPQGPGGLIVEGWVFLPLSLGDQALPDQ